MKEGIVVATFQGLRPTAFVAAVPSLRDRAPGIKFLLIAITMALCACASASEDPYALWSAGHPRQALPALHERAVATNSWDAWFDLGLAAAAAGEHGRACVWLLQARELAPGRDEPRAALLALGETLPASWVERVGPLVIPSRGWIGFSLMLIAGLGIGYALAGRKFRQGTGTVGIVALALALPGELAVWADARVDLIAVVSDTQLLDSAGQAKHPLPAGTILIRESSTPWSGRWQVRLQDGKRGFVPASDVEARP
jgi:hypothetical protein